MPNRCERTERFQRTALQPDSLERTLQGIVNPIMSFVRRVSFTPSQVQRRVTDARSTRWDEHRVEVRAQLVDATIRIIERYGAGVSMDDIAAEARVSKPKLYRYFGDKAGLNAAVAAKLGALMWDSAKATILADRLQQRRRLHEFVALPQIGHMINMEAPNYFNEAAARLDAATVGDGF